MVERGHRAGASKHVAKGKSVTYQAIGNRRLLKLAAYLRTVPPRRFNYNRWVGDDWEGAPDLSCGTTACALGWATVMPEFRRLGLKMKEDEGGGYVVLGDDTNVWTDPDPSINAAVQVFGLTEDEALLLFTPGYDEDTATPKQVAKKIEKFVARRSK